MIIDQWAAKWGIPRGAVADLRASLGQVADTPNTADKGVSESAIQMAVRLEASQKGARLWRNNSGGLYDETGRFIRFGLANDSEKLNKEIKSSDLIGITPVLITQDLVGCTIGQFTSYEIKKGGWKYSGSDREIAQLRWIQLVVALGGRAAFVSSRGVI